MATIQNTQTNSLARTGKIGLRRGLTIGGGLLQGGMDFYTRRSQHPNESLLKSALFGAATTGAWLVAPGVMWGVTLGGIAYDGVKAMTELGATAASAKYTRYGGGGMIGGGFQDNEKGYTARQRGVQAIEQSRMNARSALGNEARSLHRR